MLIRGGKRRKRLSILIASDVSITKVIGGAERYLYEQSKRLVQMGHSICMVSRRPVCAGGKEPRIVCGIREYGYMTGSLNPITFTRDLVFTGSQLCRRLIMQWGFDIMILHQPFSGLAACIAKGSQRIPKVYICHSLSHEEYESRHKKASGPAGKLYFWINSTMRMLVERYVLSVSDPVVVLSRYTREKLEAVHGISPERVRIIPGGVDLQRFRPASDKGIPRRLLGLPVDALILFTVRNLVPRMGLENMIDGFASIAGGFPKALLVIGGHGPLKETLEAKVRDHRLENRVLFTGYIPEEQLPEYYRAADLFVLPTKELEGFGLVTIEALASGLPVAATPTGGTLEILSSFMPEMLFEDCSSEAIAGLLGRLLVLLRDEPQRFRKMGKRCRKYAETNFSWDKNVTAMESLLYDTLRIRAGAR